MMPSILKKSVVLLTALLIAKSASAEDAAWRVSYHDGSANAFHAWQDAGAADARFEYVPVRPEQSSTGTYSGGERKSGRLEKKDIEALWKRVRRLESEKSHRTEARGKGTGLFALEDAEGKREFLLEMGAWLRDFDRFLRDMPSFKNPSDILNGAFPVYPGAVKGQGVEGATSLPTGKNFTASSYVTDAPLADVLGFYKARLRNAAQTQESGGTVSLKTGDGAVRLKSSNGRTSIQMTQGPM